MYFNRLGYEQTLDQNIECFDNLMLVYDGADIFWITCSNRSLENVSKYFGDEIFIMGFSLKRKNGYNMEFITNIKYKDVLDDLKDNGIYGKVELLFSEREYNKYLNFKIIAKNFDDAVSQLTIHLSTLQIEII